MRLTIAFEHFQTIGNFLKISQIDPDDAGVYTCHAFNKAGEDEANTTLTVFGTVYCQQKISFLIELFIEINKPMKWRINT